MKFSLFLANIVSMILIAACSTIPSKNANKSNIVEANSTVPRQNPIQHKTVQAAYEAEAFMDMVTIMETEQDTYNMHRQFIPSVGRNKTEYSNGDWKGPQSCMNDTTLSDDAINHILEMTKHSRLVIINEAHDTPQHREFIAHLLPFLAGQGFNIYGAETLSLSDSNFTYWKRDIAKNGFEAVSGFYLPEPSFSRLINHAMELGLELVPYEFEEKIPDSLSISERIKRREEGQARNIWERALSSHENRVILHVGYSHVKEEVDKRGRMWLASVLKYRYGIDPVTISQTNCSSPELSKGWNFSVPESTDGVDVNIHSFPETLENKRPTWYDLLGYKRHSANSFVTGNFEKAIVEASSKKSNRVVDRVFFRNGEKIDLVLKPGRYLITAWVDNSEKTFVDEIVVR